MTTKVLKEEGRLVLTRTYPTTLDAMWSAWTEPTQLAQWFGCGETKNVHATLDVRTGGTFEIIMNKDNEEEGSLVGRYLEVTPKTRLSYTWEWTGKVEMQFGESTVLVELRDVEGGIELTLTHSGFPTPEITAMHDHGWKEGLDKLEKVLGNSAN